MNRVEVAVYQKAKDGNKLCGDSYYYIETDDKFICVIADGLGSGTFARESSDAVIESIKRNYNKPMKEMVKVCNQQLQGKRGVVLGIIKIDYHTKKYSFVSVGNIGMIAISKDLSKKRTIPNSGYLSGGKKDIKVVEEVLEKEMNFIMFSDGVTSTDLSNKFYQHQDVNDVIQSFILQNKTPRKDDTTLIAFRYKEKPKGLSYKKNNII
ncbi:SpoIIE family protein phosphatase [Ornithinibacillus halophilus]|nr:SpoIIE family protein phosphatase [Ornithinibacillus halophilus]